MSTALQGIWLGVPMLTWPGFLQKQRALASMLSSLGATHTIARTQAEYLGIAVALAHRPRVRQALRARLALLTGEAPLFDTTRWVRGFESALASIWEVHAQHDDRFVGAPVRHVVIARR